MLFFINTDYNNLYKKGNRVYSKSDEIKAVYLDFIYQYLEGSEYKAICKNNGKLEYRFVNSLSLDSKKAYIIVDIPETIVNIYKMMSSSEIMISLAYIDLDWVKQSINLDRLLDDLPDYLDIVDSNGSIRLEYNNSNDVLHIEFMEQVSTYGKLLYDSTEETDMLDFIEISEKIDGILEKYKDIYDDELIDRLQIIVSEAFVDGQLDNIDLFSAIFSEYYWNKYFDKTNFDILSNMKIEVNNEQESKNA